ncbi:hypothetical protein LTR78_001007 [Recurvomyces mirabilis]|uniref:Uncharacterized protein n=1 Tax=Recurvomyces mirabilis TaxID=574656 RepID=A0AAE0WX49_9PEZI|nr:hypothetical protein LTR78_001007 [Recurvomyces mirabilis]KAK5158979.1 hypothetical protein LTS14_003087 [Recurvomyces mirabilis]
MTLRPRAVPDLPKAKVPAESTNLAASSSSWSCPAEAIPILATPPIFRIPAELRLDFYALALLVDDSDLRLLQTCKQINMEARPILYQRPLTLTSQAQFFELVQRSDPVDLLRIHDVTLHLTDISLSSLLDGFAGITAWALYQQELERLDRAFRTISGLRRLVLRPPAVNHSQLLRGMYLSFLGLIPQHHPSLQNLVIEDNKDLLNKVPSLRDLPNVHFTITTDSTPDRKQTCSRSPTVKVEVEENEEDLLADPTLPEDSGLVDRKAKTKKPAKSPKQARWYASLRHKYDQVSQDDGGEEMIERTLPYH